MCVCEIKREMAARTVGEGGGTMAPNNVVGNECAAAFARLIAYSGRRLVAA